MRRRVDAERTRTRRGVERFHDSWRAADDARATAWDTAWSARAAGRAGTPTCRCSSRRTAACRGALPRARSSTPLPSHLPTLIGGSADLAPANNTLDRGGARSAGAHRPAGRNFFFGVREHAMAAMGNGMALHGGVRPYVATFFAFTDYMRPALRLAAIMKQPVIHVLTHDSLGDGEDGPTHQPIEHLAILRATPNWVDLRPADANEVVEAMEGRSATR